MDTTQALRSRTFTLSGVAPVSWERVLTGRIRAVIYALSVLLVLVRWNGAFPLDDPYIVLYSAKVLLQGHDALYGAPALAGATSPIHLLVVTLFSVVLPPVIASLSVCVVAAMLYAAGLDRLVRKLGARTWMVPVLVVTGLLGGTVPEQLLNGLESGLAAATVAWLLALADSRRLLWIAGLAPFVRPELGILSVLLLARRWWHMDRRDVLQEAMLAAVPAAPLAAWLLISTGHLLPQTAYAKTLFFAESGVTLRRRAECLIATLNLFGGLPLCVGLIAVRGTGWVRLAFVCIVLAVAAASIPSAMTWNHCRYFTPLFPVLIAGVASLSTHRWGAALVLLTSSATLVNLPAHLMILDQEQSHWKQEGARVAATARKIPPGSVVLIHDAGLVAWSGPPLHLVDVVGLKTPSSIAWHRRYTQATCDYGDALDGIARQSRAQYAMLLPDEVWGCIGTSMQKKGWTLQPIPTQGAYRLFKLTSPQRQPAAPIRSEPSDASGDDVGRGAAGVR